MLDLMGLEIFEMGWIKAILLFFSYLALYGIGIIVSVFETAIEMQNGRGNIRNTALNTLKGFFAVSLFSIVSVELYRFCVTHIGNIDWK